MARKSTLAKKSFFNRRSRPVGSAPVSPDTIFSRRAMLLAGGSGLVWVGLLGRFAQLQLAEGDEYRKLADDNRVRSDLVPPLRGEITDRFGVSLAGHRSAGRISITREQARDLEGTLGQIGKLIDLPDARKQRIIAEARRNASFVPTLVARELSYEDFARLRLHASEMPGVQVEMGVTRSYPRTRDFAHMLGYVAKASQRDLVRLIHEDISPRLDERQKALLSQLKLDGSVHPLDLQAALPEGSDVRMQWDASRRAHYALYQHPDMRVGRSGIERVCDKALTGTRGYRKLVTNAAGRIVQELPDQDSLPDPGQNVAITIDAELQRAAIERFGEESGAAVVMDVDSGAILSLVSTPAFDPNDFVNGISQADFDLLRNNDRSPLYHKAYDGKYPPGSTFKMVVATAALEAGVIEPGERINCNSRYRFGNRTWSCWKRQGHGPMNMHNAIKQSCDVYFYEIAKRIGIEKLAETAKKFGFGQSWALGMTGGATGIVPNDAWKREAVGEPWFEGETLNIGIGQGYMSSTPLQLAVMTARIARGGSVITPRLIERGPDIPPLPGGDHQQPLNPEHMDLMRKAMFAVTSEWGGTARRAGDLGVDGVRMAGKTGTAQVRYISQAERRGGVVDNADLARHLRDHALFVGYAPHDNPRYAVSVIVEHGGGGSTAAAPVARDIMAEAIRRDSGRPANVRTAAARPGDERGAS